MFKRRTDHLGLRSALADRLLPILVAAMSFLGALALAGTLATALLAAQWRGNTAAALTIQVPTPDDPAASPGTTRRAAVLAALHAAPGVTGLTVMSTEDIDRLLAPWLGSNVAQLALPIPAIITAGWAGPGTPDSLAAVLQKLSPGTLLSTGASWAARVAALTSSLQACAAAILVIVALVAAAVVAIATHSGLAQRREAVEIIHGLGALDADIASRFASRATFLAAGGAAIGVLLALPVLFWLASLATPFANPAPGNGLPNLPPAFWAMLPTLPFIAALIGWGTAQLTVRGWLRRLA
jgi:cell division transport system permease protein